MSNKMIVYVDALNLYYGLLKKTPYRWLDIFEFVKTQCKDDILEIKFFFAEIKPTILDQDAPNRQKAYIDALKWYVSQKCSMQFIEWYFLDNVKKNWIDVNTGLFTTIITNEEKGTDVNIWVHIVNDSCKRNDYDIICLVSNDSDLSEALRIWKENWKQVFLLSPIKKITRKQRLARKKKKIRISYPAWSLIKYADSFNYDVTATDLLTSQMPKNIIINWNTITCPTSR